MLTQKLLSLSLVGTEWIIYMLVFLSVISLAVIIERLIVLRARTGGAKRLQRAISTALKKGDRDAVEEILRTDASSSAVIAYSVLQNIKNTKLDFDECLSIALSEERLSLERRITFLGTLGANAPFIGLFGTVLGIISAFHNLVGNVKGGPSVVMSGISEALVATALGLLVAIPGVIAYNYFVRRVKRIMVQAENFTRFVASYYFGGRKS
jgi:biopolymer transport protein ExbB/TolQ